MTFYEKRYRVNAVYLRWFSGYYTSKYNSNQIMSAVGRIVHAHALIDAELMVENPNWAKYEERVNDAIEIINNIEVLLKLYRTNN